MRLLYRLAILFLLLIITGCNPNNIDQKENIDLRSIIERDTGNIKIGEKREVNIGINYDMILVVPPYTSQKNLNNYGLKPELSNAISKKMSIDENYQVFLIKSNNIIASSVLSNLYSTEDGKVIKVIYPDSLKVEKKHRQHRPIEISGM